MSKHICEILINTALLLVKRNINYIRHKEDPFLIRRYFLISLGKYTATAIVETRQFHFPILPV